ncbi:MAG TPA: ATPase, partial [Kofleriaceae bacterium]|nr:ATPase [Kofleriaceae bacterium]
MMLSPAALLVLTLGYLGTLFLVARLGDRWAPARALSRRPLVAALALGVYATSWSYFGSVGFAAREGWRYLAIYLGVTASCALLPLVWAPLHRLVRARQLASLADLLAYRYQSRGLGVAVAAFLLLGSLPYQALQLRALVVSVAGLTGEASVELGLLISVALAGFGMLYGARHVSLSERHDGLVLAVALESVIKVVALLAIAIWALVSVFGGAGGLGRWLAHNPGELRAMAAPARDGDWVALLALSAGAGFLLPRQWHLAFTESAGPRALAATGWALPAYLLVLTAAVPPILWAGRALGLSGDADFYVLGLALASGSSLLSALVFLGALSAATAMILVTTVALAAMAQNHLVVPALGWARRGDLYRRLLWLRRALIALIILGGYAVYLGLRRRTGLADLGLVSFVAVAQLGPAVLGVLFWPRATAWGALAGLCAGAALWSLTLVAPLFGLEADVLGALGLAGDLWTVTTTLSVGVNALVFVGVSLLRPQRAVEAEAAATCARRMVGEGAGVATRSPEELGQRLAGVLGAEAAELELARALAEVGLTRGE